MQAFARLEEAVYQPTVVVATTQEGLIVKLVLMATMVHTVR